MSHAPLLNAPQPPAGIRRGRLARRAPSEAAGAMVLGVVVAALLAALAGIVAGCGGPGAASDKVSLQLNWFHEAEFVGYYVAETKGFYKDQNLEVTILEGGPGSPARDQVLNGAATFAITSFAEQRDMVTSQQPAVAVMAVFQIPPLVIFSLADSDIGEPADLQGRRVGTTTQYWKNVLRQTLSAAGVDPTTVTEVDVKPDNMQMLYDGTVDAWLGYAQDEPIKAQMAGYSVTNIFPADFGIGGYEGLVIAHQGTVDKDPAMVKRFVEACFEGWRYALEHPDEAAEILTTWAPENGLEFQKLAVRAVAPLVDTPQVPVGWIDAAHWQQLMGDAFDPSRPGFTMRFSPANP